MLQRIVRGLNRGEASPHFELEPGPSFLHRACAKLRHVKTWKEALSMDQSFQNYQAYNGFLGPSIAWNNDLLSFLSVMSLRFGS